jgi:hypothetical protein
MSKLNRLKFESYTKEDYLTTQEDAEAHFRVMSKFPNALGFDKKSNGYLVIHKRHSPSGLASEVPACLILKKLGYQVELVEEYDYKLSLDVRINDVIFEMKRFAEGKDLFSGIINHFRHSYRKTDKLVLHIAKKVDSSNIRRVIRQANDKYPQIKVVLLIYGYKIVWLDREMMQKADYLI